MDIVCPSCAAAYEIDETGVAETGRKVRCAACSTIWRVYPLNRSESLEMIQAGGISASSPPTFSSGIVAPGANPYATEPAEDIFGEGGPVLRKAIEAQASGQNSQDPSVADEQEAVSEEAIAAMDEAMASQDAPDVQEASLDAAALDGMTITDTAPEEPRRARLMRDEKKDRPKKKQSSFSSFLNWKTASIATAVLVAGLGVQQRVAVVKMLPQTAGLYSAIGLPVNLRGIEIRNVASRLIDDNGVSILVIDGDLQNITRQKMPLPRLRFAVKGADGQEIYVWSAQADKNSLEPGESLNFRRRLAAPPSDGKDISVRFLTPADTTAGIK